MPEIQSPAPLRETILAAQRRAKIIPPGRADPVEKLASFRQEVAAAIVIRSEGVDPDTDVIGRVASAPYGFVWVEWSTDVLNAGALIQRAPEGLRSTLVTANADERASMRFYFHQTVVHLRSDGAIESIDLPPTTGISTHQQEAFLRLHRQPIAALVAVNAHAGPLSGPYDAHAGNLAVLTQDAAGSVTFGTISLVDTGSSDGVHGSAGVARNRPRQHRRRGHWRRRPKSGGRVWIDDAVIGSASAGAKITSYRIEGPNVDRPPDGS